MRLRVSLSAVLLFPALASACGANSTRVNGPDGRGTWYSITCRRSQANCTEEAGNVCPSGYQVESSDSSTPVLVTENGAMVGYNGAILVKCR